MFRMAFFFFLVFTVVVYLRPQDLFPALHKIHLAKLSAGLSVLAFLLGWLRKPEQPLIKNLELRLMMLFGVFIVASVPFSLWKGGSVKFIQEVVVNLYIIFVIMMFVLDSPRRIRRFLFLFLACGGFLVLFAMYERITGGGTLVKGGRIMTTIGGMVNDPNDRALLFVMMLPLALFMGLQARSLVGKLYYMVLSILFVVGDLETLSRGGMLGLVAVAVAFACKIFRDRKGLVFLLGVLVFVSLFFVPGSVWYRASSIFDSTKDEAGTVAARKTIFTAGLKIYAQNPVFGVGVVNFTVAEGESHGNRGKYNAAHNTLIQVAAELGTFGLLTFLGFYWVSFKNARRIQRVFTDYELDPSMVDLARGLEVALVGFFVCSFFLSQAYNWNFYYLLGLSAALRRVAWTIEEEEGLHDEGESEEYDGGYERAPGFQHD